MDVLHPQGERRVRVGFVFCVVAFLEAKGIRGRVALGKVFRASFSHSRWSEIVLG